MTYDKRLHRLLAEPHQELAYTIGLDLTGFSVKVKPDSYLLVVKGRKRLDGNIVAFIEMPTFLGTFEYLYDHCTKTNAPLKWRKDKWARD